MQRQVQLALVLLLTVAFGCNRELDINQVGGTRVVFQLQMPLGISEDEAVRSVTQRLDPTGVFDVAASVSGDSLTIVFPRRAEADLHLSRLHQGLLLASTLEIRGVALTTDQVVATAVADADPDAAEIRSGDQLVAIWRSIANDSKGAPRVQTAPTHFTRQHDGKTELLLRVTPDDISSMHLDTANKVFTEQEQPAIGIKLNDSGTEVMQRLSTANNGRNLAIVVGQEIIAAPVVMSTIADRAQITGNFTDSETQAMVGQLRLGSLPFQVTEKPPQVSVVTGEAN